MSQGVEKDKSESTKEKTESDINYKNLLKNKNDLQSALDNSSRMLANEKDRSNGLKNDYQQLKEQNQILKNEYNELANKVNDLKQKFESEKNKNNTLINEISNLKGKNQTLERKNTDITTSNNKTLEALADFISKVTPEDLNSVTANNQKIVEALNKLGKNDLGAIAAEMQRIITMAQLMDVFEFYIDSKNNVNVKNPAGKTQIISIGDVEDQTKCKIAFQNQIVDYIKNQPQLKKMAIIMIIHGDCGFLHRKIVVEVLNESTNHIRQNSANNSEIFVTAPLFIDKEKK